MTTLAARDVTCLVNFHKFTFTRARRLRETA
jgi:hypothetical protein